MAHTSILRICHFVSSYFLHSGEAALRPLGKLAFFEVTAVAVEINHHCCKHWVSYLIKFKHLFPRKIFIWASQNMKPRQFLGEQGNSSFSSRLLAGSRYSVLLLAIPKDSWQLNCKKKEKDKIPLITTCFICRQTWSL